MGELREFIFTFGFGQRYAGGYYVIKAEDMMQARQEMNRRFGREWSMMYHSKEEAGVDKYGLYEVE